MYACVHYTSHLFISLPLCSSFHIIPFYINSVCIKINVKFAWLLKCNHRESPRTAIIIKSSYQMSFNCCVFSFQSRTNNSLRANNTYQTDHKTSYIYLDKLKRSGRGGRKKLFNCFAPASKSRALTQISC